MTTGQDETSAGRSTFYGRDLGQIDLRSADLRGAFLMGTNFGKAHGADFSMASLEKAVIVYAEASKAAFTNADLREAYIHDSDFSGADMTSATTENVILCNTTMPVGQVDNAGC